MKCVERAAKRVVGIDPLIIIPLIESIIFRILEACLPQRTTEQMAQDIKSLKPYVRYKMKQEAKREANDEGVAWKPLFDAMTDEVKNSTLEEILETLEDAKNSMPDYSNL